MLAGMVLSLFTAVCKVKILFAGSTLASTCTFYANPPVFEQLACIDGIMLTKFLLDPS